MARPEPHDVAFFGSIDELRAWLEANAQAAHELWVGLPRVTKERRPQFAWADIVDEVLCVGWIDGLRMPLGDAHAIRITPRRPGSVWSARNVRRVEALRAEGRMRPAGEAAFARRREDRTAIYSFDDGWQLDEAAEATIRERPAAWQFLEAQPAGYRRTAAHWVMAAQRPDTRARRLAALVEACESRARPPQLSGRARRPAAR